MPAASSSKSPFDPNKGPRLQKIAFLGWGSLVWDQQNLKTRGQWQKDGPELKIEFLRRSRRSTNPPQEYLSLVLDRSGTRVQSLWAIADHETLNGAKMDLWARETPTSKTGQAIHSWTRGQKLPKLIFDLDKWAEETGVEAVVWTGLECKWPRNGQAPSKQEAIDWLKKLRDAGQAAFAERYVREAPEQIDTVFRRSFITELGWVPCPKDTEQRRKRCSLIAAAGCAVVFIIAIGIWLNRRPPQLDESHTTTPPPQLNVVNRVPETITPPPIEDRPSVATPTPARRLTPSELTESDKPPTILLRKASPSFFKKGVVVTLKEDAPLFFEKQFLRTGKKGERFEVLDYRPETKRIYGRALMPDGKVIAVSFLEYRVGDDQATILPAGTGVRFEELVDDNALVSFEGFKFLVPISDTDLLDRATQQREQREVEARRRMQVEEQENRAREEARRQVAAQQERSSAPTPEPQQRSTTFGGWNSISNGRTWNSAPEGAKRNLCQRLATVTRKGNSAAFYYDALTSLFDTDDPYILNTSLDGATKLIEASSSSLPLSQRNY